jgi:hypothetical protein
LTAAMRQYPPTHDNPVYLLRDDKGIPPQIESINRKPYQTPDYYSYSFAKYEQICR